MLTLGLSAAVAFLAVVDARTTVSVVEIGAGGVARRTTSPASKTSVSAVSSFWASMHDVVNGQNRRRARSLQYPGMTVVPDLFKRADGGLAIGIVGNAVNLDNMPTVAGLLEEEKSVGHFHLSGSQGLDLMSKAGKTEAHSDGAVFGSNLKKKTVGKKGGVNVLDSVSVRVNDEQTAADVDASVADLVASLKKQAEETGVTFVLHMVVEDDSSHRRLTERRLEDAQEEEGDDDAAADAYADDGSVSAKSIFQIQYFNVVLWTSIGLTVVLLAAIGMTIAMPLEPDTLLFGESAKVVGE